MTKKTCRKPHEKSASDKQRAATVPQSAAARPRRKQMEHDAELTKARIAAREGISRARVTQVINLLQLPAEIQAGLQWSPAPLEIHSFSERSLRLVLSCGDEETQMSRWPELVRELRGSAGN